MSNFDDPRFSDIVIRGSVNDIPEADIIIFGVPTDEGILRNGGRTGASQAPVVIQKYFERLTINYLPDTASVENIKIACVGSVAGESLEEIHFNAATLTAKLIGDDKVVIALGGGHDVTYPLAAGFHQGIRKKDFSLVSVDAHLDVRPKKNGLHHSGSSFRLLIEENILKPYNFTEFGIQPFSYSKLHFDWLKMQDARLYIYNDDLHSELDTVFATTSLPQYISFDIDSVQSSAAPGCSAPSPIGLDAYSAITICSLAGLHATTQMLDIVEVSPPFDIDNKTSRLAARMIAAFIAGVANRKK